MNKQELIERIEGLKNLFGNKSKYIEIDAVIELASELDEPQKITVPQFVADWIEYCKEHNFTLFGCLDPANGFESLAGETFEGDVRKCIRWCRKESNNFARAWLDGYTVEKEKRYLVKIKGVDSCFECLYYGMGSNTWSFRMKNESGYFRRNHTRKELEEAGFGEVFNSPLFEVEEVE
jgi:hypothetical protein